MDDIITQTGNIETDIMNNISSSIKTNSILNSYTPSSIDENFSSGFSWTKAILYILIIVIVYFIITNLGRILSYLGYNTAEVAKQTISMSAEGSKSIIDVASGTITGGIDSLEKGLSLSGKNIRNNIDNKNVLVQETDDDNEFNEMLNISKNRVKPKNEIDSLPSSGKHGFCYVGEDRGYRSCIKIGNADKCMSGDIFPSQEICINPALRD